MTQTFEEFKDYYEKYGYTITGKTNIKQGLKYQYKKYVKKEEKKKLWKDCRDEAFRRNPNGEQFFDNLTDREFDFYIELKGDMSIFDPCHIIGKGECPKKELVNNPDNILIAPRYFHSLIDQYRNPFTAEHEIISKEERETIWIRFIGKEMMQKLKEIKLSS